MNIRHTNFSLDNKKPGPKSGLVPLFSACQSCRIGIHGICTLDSALIGKLGIDTERCLYATVPHPSLCRVQVHSCIIAHRSERRSQIMCREGKFLPLASLFCKPLLPDIHAESLRSFRMGYAVLNPLYEGAKASNCKIQRGTSMEPPALLRKH